MFPFCFEWAWDISHIVFMGGLWYALSIIGAGMTFAIVKSVFDCAGHDDQDHGHH
ncbi:MAG: hypothetical protein J7K96_10830 [Desulfobacteraceae bacterium]|nr:hypothetical protein [Desulfobacteraceae bacterium]